VKLTVESAFKSLPVTLHATKFNNENYAW